MSFRVRDLLTSDGWTKTSGDDKYGWSSMGPVSTVYEKEGKQVILGLNVNKYPPGVISPRPKCEFDVSKVRVRLDERILDPEMASFIDSLTDEQLLKELNSDYPFKDYVLSGDRFLRSTIERMISSEDYKHLHEELKKELQEL